MSSCFCNKHVMDSALSLAVAREETDVEAQAESPMKMVSGTRATQPQASSDDGLFEGRETICCVRPTLGCLWLLVRTQEAPKGGARPQLQPEHLFIRERPDCILHAWLQQEIGACVLNWCTQRALVLMGGIADGL